MPRLLNKPGKRIPGYWQIEIIAEDTKGKRHQVAWNGAPAWVASIVQELVNPDNLSRDVTDVWRTYAREQIAEEQKRTADRIRRRHKVANNGRR
jgi:hypothetical protein